jgi:hypothetical protein
MKSLFTRIQDFLEGRPVQSDSTGLFIERRDLEDIIAVLHERYEYVKGPEDQTMHLKPPVLLKDGRDPTALEAVEILTRTNGFDIRIRQADGTTIEFTHIPAKCLQLPERAKTTGSISTPTKAAKTQLQGQRLRDAIANQPIPECPCAPCLDRRINAR